MAPLPRCSDAFVDHALLNPTLLAVADALLLDNAEEASPLTVDRERAAQLPHRARDLLGWSSDHSNGGGRTWLVDFEDATRLFD